MTPEIQAGIASVKASFELLKAIKGVSDAVQINSTVIELQTHILSAQQALLNAQDSINTLAKEKSDLEARLVKHAEWQTRRSQYRLAQIRDGLSVYLFEPSKDSCEPQHWACPKCFSEEKIYILQKTSPASRAYKCPKCGFEMVPDSDIPMPRNPNPDRRW